MPFEFTAGAHDSGSSLRLEGDRRTRGPRRPFERGRTGGPGALVLRPGQGRRATWCSPATASSVPEGKDFSYDSYFGLD